MLVGKPGEVVLIAACGQIWAYFYRKLTAQICLADTWLVLRNILACCGDLARENNGNPTKLILRERLLVYILQS